MYLYKCKACNNRYTLQQICPQCHRPSESAHPARFTPDDKNSEYRVRYLARYPGFSIMDKPSIVY